MRAMDKGFGERLSPSYILMLSIHGLVRGHNPELGRDADTGGQVGYVVDLARTLGARLGGPRVDLITRLIDAPEVSPDYACEEERLNEKARIIRLPFGPKGYVRKELLWDYLDELVDRCLQFLRRQKKTPDVVHSHYADAGYVGVELSRLLGIPQIHTGHSLGRVKRARLLAAGEDAAELERRFHFARRIAAEEETLRHASLVIASTRQELEQQYATYECFKPQRAVVIPPGVDVSRFRPRLINPQARRTRQMLDRFLRDPYKPSVLAIARPVESKNLVLLVDAFGKDRRLRERANLIILAGNREDLDKLDEPQREVVSQLLAAVDRHDLYGIAALPKQHALAEVPEVMRYVARRRGVFVNPAENEPFGLTLIEAAAAGLPVVATEGGGPRDILANCHNGILIEKPTEELLAAAMNQALDDGREWHRWSRSGKAGVARHYTWESHAATYLKKVAQIKKRRRKSLRRGLSASTRRSKSSVPFAVRALICDLDFTLTGDDAKLAELIAWLRRDGGRTAFGIATGRIYTSAVAELNEQRIPAPDVLIAAVGSEIYYGPDLVADEGWSNYIGDSWRREDLQQELGEVPGLALQPQANQGKFKLSYVVDPKLLPPIETIESLLRDKDLHANLVYSSSRYLDVLPQRASKGTALRYLAYKWGMPLEHFMVVGDSGNDMDMFGGKTLGVIVANHTHEMETLRGRPNVYFSREPHAGGILEAMDFYDFGNVGTTGTRPAPAEAVTLANLSSVHSS